MKVNAVDWEEGRREGEKDRAISQQICTPVDHYRGIKKPHQTPEEATIDTALNELQSTYRGQSREKGSR
jgi:hypothetical protein